MVHTGGKSKRPREVRGKLRNALFNPKQTGPDMLALGFWKLGTEGMVEATSHWFTEAEGWRGTGNSDGALRKRQRRPWKFHSRASSCCLGAGKHGGERAGPSLAALPAVPMLRASESCCLGPYLESCSEKDCCCSVPHLRFVPKLS